MQRRTSLTCADVSYQLKTHLAELKMYDEIMAQEGTDRENGNLKDCGYGKSMITAVLGQIVVAGNVNFR